MAENKIRILPKELVDQIAAGEVVERPASVVKELVENSLDAGAKNIVLELENGGINLVKVIDDGCGMTREDARLALVLHATSKINSIDDLFNIQTMGFRGEALASVSAVSDFSLITKTADDLAGLEVKMFDQQLSTQEIGCPTGTVVSVRNLFYNIPARKKYLKTALTEYNHIVDLFFNYVLAYPQVGWKLIHNNHLAYQFSATADLKMRLSEVLGQEITENLLPVNYNALEMKVTGFIGKPQISRNNRKLQFLFVNNRPVDEFVIAKQVKEAFATLIPHNLYPVYILFLQIDPQQVDVNVHPRKLEVRFSNPQKIYQIVYRAVAETLDNSELTKNIFHNNFSRSENVQKFNPVNSFSPVKQLNLTPQTDYQQPKLVSTQSNFSQAIVSVPDSSVEPEIKVNVLVNEHETFIINENFKLIGQVKNSYLIIETEAGLRIMDQHAASERVQYEKLRKSLLKNKIIKQPLLLPATIDLALTEAQVLAENLDLMEQLGFELAEFSNHSFMLNAVPQMLARADFNVVLHDLVAQFSERVTPESGELIPGKLDRALKTMACRSAVKFGDKLNNEEMAVLVQELEKCENKYTCVHGRPCVVEYSFEELEKLFKRRV